MEKPVGVESLAERGVVPAGMIGAVAGAVGSVVLGAATGATHPEACGAAGAMLGGATVALGWWAVAGLVHTVATAGAWHRASRAAAPAVRHAAPHA